MPKRKYSPASSSGTTPRLHFVHGEEGLWPRIMSHSQIWNRPLRRWRLQLESWRPSKDCWGWWWWKEGRRSGCEYRSHDYEVGGSEWREAGESEGRTDDPNYRNASNQHCDITNHPSYNISRTLTTVKLVLTVDNPDNTAVLRTSRRGTHFQFKKVIANIIMNWLL